MPVSGSRAADAEMPSALATCRFALIWVGVVSGVVNVLYLTGSFFMLEVYDRVIPSGSIPSLIGLCVLAFVLFTLQGALDAVRARVLTRIGSVLDERLSRRAFGLVLRAPIVDGKPADGVVPLRDLDQIRSFLSGNGPVAFFDLPWIPLYVGICFVFHPMIGVAALCGAMLLLVITACTEIFTRRPIQAAMAYATARNGLAEAGRRNAEVLAAMGMGGRFADIWGSTNGRYMAAQRQSSDVVSGFGALSKVSRMALQSGVLALGAYLVINGEATPGIIIASSILVSRALAPAELAIANWKGFVAARQSWRRLSRGLTQWPEVAKVMELAPPLRSLSVQNVSVKPPSGSRLTVSDVDFELQAGDGLGIIGPSASGKSSLARAIVGIWPAVRGKVRLDGATLTQWCPVELGAHIGYLPQEVDLFAGTVADNIGRFEPDRTPGAVVDAAMAAGVHGMILQLPDGYDTLLGESGHGLSQGQRQRIGLARTLFGSPFLVVLDEPNSNLDPDGDAALTLAILGVRKRGGIVIVVAHRPSALAGVDLVLAMADGKALAVGTKEDVLKRMIRPAGSPVAPEPDVRRQDVVRQPRRETDGLGAPTLRVLQEHAS